MLSSQIIPKAKERSESQKALRLLGIGMIAGVLTIPIHALQAENWIAAFVSISVGALLAGTSALVGGTLGFLFGIPRTLQQDAKAPNPASDSAASERTTEYQANTNLEQISDWLTKILVGVGLTQVSEIRSGLSSISAFAAQGLGTQPYSQVFAFGLLSYSAFLGFLFGYLWTRLFLASALRDADRASIGALAVEVKKITEKAETTERKLEDFRKQSELDAAALNLAYRQLNPSPELPEVPLDELKAAVATASRPIKVQIFNQAWQVRSDNWRGDKLKMSNAIPLLRALVADDKDDRYHMNHGQLGFALKDKDPPEWKEAERELTKAIELRGSWEDHGWIFYEYNRAVCRIMIDPQFALDQVSEQGPRLEIMNDLHVAIQNDDVKRIVRDDPIIKKWMKLNSIAERDFR